MSAHTHGPEHRPKGGTGWQVCECGATRREENGCAIGPWHVCSVCVPDSTHGNAQWAARSLCPCSDCAKAREG